MAERRFFSAAAIAGSIAEVIYPVPQGLRGRVIDRMDRFLLNTIVESVDFLYRRFLHKRAGASGSAEGRSVIRLPWASGIRP